MNVAFGRIYDKSDSRLNFHVLSGQSWLPFLKMSFSLLSMLPGVSHWAAASPSGYEAGPYSRRSKVSLDANLSQDE